mgnify:CR=1 FL=1
MSGHKITGIHAIGVEIPKGMSFKELMEQLLEGGEVELEKELDEETRQPETGKCDCPVCDPDKDTVEERLFHPVDQWQMWPVTCMTRPALSNTRCSSWVRTSWRSRRR